MLPIQMTGSGYGVIRCNHRSNDERILRKSLGSSPPRKNHGRIHNIGFLGLLQRLPCAATRPQSMRPVLISSVLMASSSMRTGGACGLVSISMPSTNLASLFIPTENLALLYLALNFHIKIRYKGFVKDDHGIL